MDEVVRWVTNTRAKGGAFGWARVSDGGRFEFRSVKLGFSVRIRVIKGKRLWNRIGMVLKEGRGDCLTRYSSLWRFFGEKLSNSCDFRKNLIHSKIPFLTGDYDELWMNSGKENLNFSTGYQKTVIFIRKVFLKRKFLTKIFLSQM